LGQWTPTADDIDPNIQLIAVGTLLSCRPWADHPEDYSGKRHTTRLNVQVAVDLAGDPVWVSDPQPGKTHDIEALRLSGLLDASDAPTHIGDEGYIGAGMITPFRKPPGGELLDWQKQFNRDISGSSQLRV
jgi:hypothetical protein